ncbi:MAG: LOG family protein, partial [Planctomycetota bacterium]|nr:LOG family protein [Planctomycetota bacterium]
DEGFETLTLIQTGKSEILPVVFLDSPGGSYWKDWDEYVKTHLHERGLISGEDLALFHVTDDVDDAIYRIRNFYSNYHSSRYVREKLVIRLRRAPDREQLAALNDDFSDLLAKGTIEVTAALPSERGEVDHYPRVTLNFNRHAVGRLRMLIDRLNTYVTERASPPLEAAPHQIVKTPLTPEAETEEQDED